MSRAHDPNQNEKLDRTKTQANSKPNLSIFMLHAKRKQRNSCGSIPSWSEIHQLNPFRIHGSRRGRPSKGEGMASSGTTHQRKGLLTTDSPPVGVLADHKHALLPKGKPALGKSFLSHTCKHIHVFYWSGESILFFLLKTSSPLFIQMI